MPAAMPASTPKSPRQTSHHPSYTVLSYCCIIVPLYPQDEDGFTALHLAARQGHVAITLALLGAGADVSRVCQNWTPVHYAVRACVRGQPGRRAPAYARAWLAAPWPSA